MHKWTPTFLIIFEHSLHEKGLQRQKDDAQKAFRVWFEFPSETRKGFIFGLMTFLKRDVYSALNQM